MAKVIVLIALVVHLSSSAVVLNGAGASFSHIVYSHWFQLYHNSHPGVAISYNATGSAIGKGWINGELDLNRSEQIIFAETDFPLEPRHWRRYPNIVMVPMVAGAIVVGYNLPGVTSLQLSQEVLCKIFSGRITHWRDAEIVVLNPDARLPDRKINVVVRRDDSDTTDTFTQALRAFNASWNPSRRALFRSARILKWEEVSENWSPAIRDFAVGNEGVAGTMTTHIGSLGYLSMETGTQLIKLYQFGIAMIENRAGNYVRNAREGVKAGLDQVFDLNHLKAQRFTVDLLNPPGNNSYPIGLVTYLLVNQSTSKNVSCEQMKNLMRFIAWALNDDAAKKIVISAGLVPLSTQLVKSIETEVINRFTCRGQYLRLLMAEDKEQSKSATWYIVFVIILATVVILCAIFATHRWIRFGKNDWFLPPHGILLSDPPPSLESRLKIWEFETRNGSLDDEEVILNVTPIVKALFFASGSFNEWIAAARKLRHPNLQILLGLTKFPGKMNAYWFVHPGEEMRSLHEILANSPYELEVHIKVHLAKNVCSGLAFLHRSKIVHGLLDTWNCQLGEDWRVRIGNWGETKLLKISGGQGSHWTTKKVVLEVQNEELIQRFLFRHPSAIANSDKNSTTTVNENCDVYSLALVLVEIFTRMPPFSREARYLGWAKVLKTVLEKGKLPNLEGLDFPLDILEKVVAVLKSSSRIPVPGSFTGYSPTGILDWFEDQYPTDDSTIVSVLMGTMTKYLKDLEKKTKSYQELSERMSHLLERMLPKEVAVRLQRGKSVAPKLYESVSILFCDIVSFGKICSLFSPWEVINLLNEFYTIFDHIIAEKDVFKVETVGDAYMLASGLPHQNGSRHILEIAEVALSLHEATAAFKIPHGAVRVLSIRAGISTGPVTAGLVGVTMPRYCLFGEAVNTASQMKSTGEAKMTQITASAAHLLTSEMQPMQYTLIPKESIIKPEVPDRNQLFVERSVTR